MFGDGVNELAPALTKLREFARDNFLRRPRRIVRREMPGRAATSFCRRAEGGRGPCAGSLRARVRCVRAWPWQKKRDQHDHHACARENPRPRRRASGVVTRAVGAGADFIHHVSVVTSIDTSKQKFVYGLAKIQGHRRTRFCQCYFFSNKAAARRSISSGAMSSMWVANIHTCPNGSATLILRSP